MNITILNQHISPYKLKSILYNLRKKTYREVLNTLFKITKISKFTIWNNLYLLMLNIQKKYNIKRENLIITEIFVNKGSQVKKIQPQSKGYTSKLTKRMAHLTIGIMSIK